MNNINPTNNPLTTNQTSSNSKNVSQPASLCKIVKYGLVAIALLSGAVDANNTNYACGSNLPTPENFYATAKTYEIAARLGVPNPKGFQVYTSYSLAEGALNEDGDKICLSPDFAQALRDDSMTDYTSQEVQGVIAHELGHGVL